MTAQPLPDRPDLAQLRRRAKELKRAGDAPTLALAQLAIAREHGFASWPRLVAEVERRTQSVAERTAAFLEAVASNRPNRAVRLLRETPAIATHDVFGAAAAGDTDAVAAFVARDAALVNARDTHRDLTPLFHAVCAQAPPVVQLLLERGADPDDGDSLYHATELDDHACLRLLLAHGATEEGSSALAHMLDADDPEGTRLLLEQARRRRIRTCCATRSGATAAPR